MLPRNNTGVYCVLVRHSVMKLIIKGNICLINLKSIQKCYNYSKQIEP